MEAIIAERAQLEAAIKEITLKGLDALIAHNVKGADLIKAGVESLMSCAAEFEDHVEQLKTILNLLKPVFELARSWLLEFYAHLVALFDWAKEKWNEIFG